jgi:hypothetical protein
MIGTVGTAGTVSEEPPGTALRASLSASGPLPRVDRSDRSGAAAAWLSA